MNIFIVMPQYHYNVHRGILMQCININTVQKPTPVFRNIVSIDDRLNHNLILFSFRRELDLDVDSTSVLVVKKICF